MRDLLRIACIVFGGSILGLVGNGLSPRPLPLLSSDGPGALPDPADRMEAAALRTALKEGRPILVVDVRTLASFTEDHLPEAVSMPAPDFLDHYSKPAALSLLRAASEIVIVCESRDCPSGDRVAQLLRALGYSNVRVLLDGWRGFRAANPERRAS